MDNLSIYANLAMYKDKKGVYPFSEKSGFEPPGVKHNI